MFNGTYTVTSPTGEHRTFSVKTQAADAKFAAGKRVVALLTGSNNETDYTGFGFVTEAGIQVWKSKQTDFYLKVATMLWELGTAEENRYTRKGFRLLLEKRCMRCNRKLTHPTSIETGIGPECAGRA